MSKTEPSMDEINSVLFDVDIEGMNAASGVDAAAKSEPRLLKQKGISAELESLAPVPANKRPLIQAAVIGVIALPIGWGLVSAFSGGGTTSEPTQPSAAPAEVQEVERLKTANQEKDQRIKDLEIENGLSKQKLEVVPVQPRQPTSPKTQPPPQSPTRSTVTQSQLTTSPRRVTTISPPRRVSTPASPQRVRRPVYYAKAPTAVSRSTSSKPSTSQAKSAATARARAKAKPQPQVDPMQAWLAAANRGHYIAPNRDMLTADASYGAAQPAVYTASTQPTSYPARPAGAASTPPAQTEAIPTYEPLGTDPNSQIGQATAPGQTESPPAGLIQSPSSAPVVPSNPERLLDIGSSANAVLQSAVAWTADGPEQTLSHRLRLKEGFKNQKGIEVLPKGTDLIAQVTEKTSSGLFFMEVTHVLQSSHQDRVPVTSRALQIVAEDGSPLQAKLKQKGGGNFLADAAAVLAPGIERAMGSIASSADSLILEDGDRSLIRTSGDNSNPLAAGVSGVAEGVAQKFGQQNNNSRRDTSAPYFKLPEGETVRILVNQDVQL